MLNTTKLISKLEIVAKRLVNDLIGSTKPDDRILEISLPNSRIFQSEFDMSDFEDEISALYGISSISTLQKKGVWTLTFSVDKTIPVRTIEQKIKNTEQWHFVKKFNGKLVWS